ncbi:MAG: carbohydrate-binding protein [Planctomycetota bacterium]
MPHPSADRPHPSPSDHSSLHHLDTLEPRVLLSAAPTVTEIGLVREDVLAIKIVDSQILHGGIVDYIAQPGDIIDDVVQSIGTDSQGQPIVKHTTPFVWQDLNGNGTRQSAETRGIFLGDPGDLANAEMRTFDGFIEDRPNLAIIDATGSYSVDRLGSAADPSVQDVWRKTEPIEIQDVYSTDVPWARMQNTVFLDLSAPLVQGATYRIQFTDPKLGDYTFTYNDKAVRTDALHVNQVGFRPTDPDKAAYLSFWAGSGGALDFADLEGQSFHLINAAGTIQHTGTIPNAPDRTSQEQNDTLPLYRYGYDPAQNDPDDFEYSANYVAADVWRLDFTAFNQSGDYRVYIPGLGVSHEFTINNNAYDEVYKAVMQGLYTQRSGIEIDIEAHDGSTWTKQRSFNPADGVVIQETTVPYLGANEFLAFTDPANLTGGTVPVYGGYMDAGDWDRNINHLQVSWSLLDLFEMFPVEFENWDLGLPDSGSVLPDAVYNGVDLPDLLDEALWTVDFFRRLQQSDGGVKGGIESAAHPIAGTPSWHEQLGVFAYGADANSSFKYAAVAAKAAAVVAPYSQAISDLFLASAIKAYDYAIQNVDFTLHAADRTKHEKQTQRNGAWAGAELYRVTGGAGYQQTYLDYTDSNGNPNSADLFQHESTFAALWTYAITDRPDINTDYQFDARRGLKHSMQTYFINQSIDRNPFGVGKNGQAATTGWGVGTHPANGAEFIFNAFALADNAAERESFLTAGQSMLGVSLGANPKNLAFITGVGDAFSKEALHLDSVATGNTAPKGLALGGPFIHSETWHVDFFLKEELNQEIFPKLRYWPVMENYFEFWRMAPSNEYTVQQTFNAVIYSAGYLAALSGNSQPSLPPTPDLTPPPPGSGAVDGVYQQGTGSSHLVSIQAEHYTGIAAGTDDQWTVQSGGTGGEHLESGPDGGQPFNAPGYVTDSPRLDYRVNFTETGTHYVWVRGKAGGNTVGSSDSLHVGLDGVHTPTADRMSGFGSGFSWRQSTMDGPVATLNVTSPGEHTLNLWMREDGFDFDKIVLTTDPGYNPNSVGGGSGPAESALVPDGPPPPPPPTQSPYNGVVRDATSFVEAEYFDEGGLGLAYQDDANREGNQSFRAGETVDVTNKSNASGPNGGMAVGYTATGEWLEYTVYLPSGSYDFELTYSSNVTAPGDLNVSVDGQSVGTLTNLTSTGNWNSFQTLTLPGVQVANGGTETIVRLEVLDGGMFDIDGFRFVPVTTPATPFTVQAEAFTPALSSGVQVQSNHLGYIQHNNHAGYANVDFANGYDQVRIRWATELDGGLVEVRTGAESGPGSTLHGTYTLGGAFTDGWTDWTGKLFNLDTSISGVQDLYLVFRHPTAHPFEYLFNVDWVEFS